MTESRGRPSFVDGDSELRLESALLRFFEQFGSVLRSQFNYFLDERCFLRCIDLGRRSGTRRNRCSHLFEELLLACRRADAKHPHRLRRGAMELVRSLAMRRSRLRSSEFMM